MDLNLILGALYDMNSLFQWVIEHAGYLMVFALMVLESSIVPFPSEVVVPPAAYLAVTKGDMNIVLVVLVATAGALVGAWINYLLSLWVGRPLVYAFADSRIGHACMITRAKVERAEVYFDKHGAMSTFIGRLIPVIRQLISVPAGLARMNPWVFSAYTTLGAGVWNVVLALLGYWLGKTVPLSQLMDKVEYYNDYLTYVGLGIGVICLGVIVWNAMRKK